MVGGPAQYGTTALTLRCTKGDGKPGVSRCMPGAALSLWRPGRPRLTGQPSSRTGENPPYRMSGGIEETSASFEARSAPRSYPTQSLLGRLDNQAEFSAPERSSRSGLCLLHRESPQHVHEIAEPLAPDLVCPLLLKLAQGWGRMVWTPSTASVCQSGGVASHARRRP